jgi:hypothetical protein
MKGIKMRKHFSIKDAFTFSLDFIKSNRLYLIIIFIIYLFVDFIGTIINSIFYNSLNTINYSSSKIHYIKLVSKLFSIFSNKPFPFYVPDINIFGIISLYKFIQILLMFSTYYIFILFVLSAISWKDKHTIDIKNMFRNTFFSTTILSLIPGYILLALTILACLFGSFFPILIIAAIFNNPALVLLYFIIIPIGIVLTIYYLISYTFFPYIIIDDNVPTIQSIKDSGVITKGIKWNLIWFFILTVLIRIPFYYLKQVKNLIIKSPLILYIIDLIYSALFSTFLIIFIVFAIFHIFRQLIEHKEEK